MFLLDRTAGTTTHVNVSAAAPYTTSTRAVSVSANGRFVTFVSRLPGLRERRLRTDVTDVFRRDLVSATTARLSLSAAGAQLLRKSSGGAMPAAGGAVVFLTGSAAVAGDTNSARDVFLRR